MKRWMLAGLLVPFALTRTGARADPNDALGSLVGMAGAAASDKGPEAGEIPPDEAPVEERRAAAAPAEDAPKTEFGSAQIAKPERKTPTPAAKREAAKEDEPVVTVPAAAEPRVWTKLFSSLLPPMTRAIFFEVEESTAARRVRPAPAPAATPASVAGSAQGLLELVATTTAPPPPER